LIEHDDPRRGSTAYLGAEQRVATWLQALGYNAIDIVRQGDPVGSEPDGPIEGMTATTSTLIATAQHLSSMSGQSLDLDRLILAGLVTPGSFPWRQLVRTVGRGVNFHCYTCGLLGRHPSCDQR
jgi:hypothetical protein